MTSFLTALFYLWLVITVLLAGLYLLRRQEARRAEGASDELADGVGVGGGSSDVDVREAVVGSPDLASPDADDGPADIPVGTDTDDGSETLAAAGRRNDSALSARATAAKPSLATSDASGGSDGPGRSGGRRGSGRGSGASDDGQQAGDAMDLVEDEKVPDAKTGGGSNDDTAGETPADGEADGTDKTDPTDGTDKATKLEKAEKSGKSKGRRKKRRRSEAPSRRRNKANVDDDAEASADGDTASDTEAETDAKTDDSTDAGAGTDAKTDDSADAGAGTDAKTDAKTDAGGPLDAGSSPDAAEDSDTVVDLLDGVEMPVELELEVAYLSEAETHAIFISPHDDAGMVGTAFADELVRVGYEITPRGVDRAEAGRGDDRLSLRICPDAASELDDQLERRYPFAGYQDLAIEVWTGVGPAPVIVDD